MRKKKIERLIAAEIGGRYLDMGVTVVLTVDRALRLHKKKHKH